MSDVSDGELFITQSKFSCTQSQNIDINSEFEDLLNDTTDFEIAEPSCEECQPVFDLEFDSDDELLCAASQQIEKELEEQTHLVTNPITETTTSEAKDHRGNKEENDTYDGIAKTSMAPSATSCATAHEVTEDFRFGKPLSESDIAKLCDSSRCQNTVNKSNWSVKLYQSWALERRIRDTESGWINEDIVVMAKSETKLNMALMKFIAEVRNQKGEDYYGNTLYEIVGCLQFHLRSHGVHVSLFDSPMYAGMREVLNSRMRELARQGIGIEKRKADIITEQQEDRLWESGVLGDDTPQKLLNALVYLLGLNFALRAGDEHRFLRIGPNSQICIFTDGQNEKRMKYTEDVSKTNKGGMKDRKLQRKTVIVSENKERPERCLIRMYEKYMSLRNSHGKCQAFYLKPLKKPKEGTWSASITWFADSPMGVHPLRSTIARVCREAGLQGYFTNHSLRATAATRLYNEGIDEQLIAEKTGHRSTAIRSYKRTSVDLADKVDMIVQRKKPRSPAKDKTVVLPSSTQSASRERQFKFCLKDGVEFSFSF